MGDACIRRHPHLTASFLLPNTTRFAISRDVLASISRIGLRITTADASCASLTFQLPNGHILCDTTTLVLLGLASYKSLAAAEKTTPSGRTHRLFLCGIISGQITLPPPIPAANASSCFYYTTFELSMAQRDMSHASIDALFRAFLSFTLSCSYFATIRDIARSAFPANSSPTCPAAPATPFFPGPSHFTASSP